MKYEKEHIDALIARWLEGSATAEDVQALKFWAAESEENRRILEDYNRLFQFNLPRADQSFDADTAWDKLFSRMQDEKKSGDIPITRAGNSRLYRIAIAASLMVAVSVITFITVKNSTPQVRMTLAAAGEIVNDTLPDGTGISLFENSNVVYKESHDSRIAELDGEARFTISENRRQFFVKVDELIIEDLGTDFHVLKDSVNGRTIVTVYEGSVSLYTRNLKGIQLQHGEQGYYDQQKTLFHKMTPKERMDLMPAGGISLVFRDTPLHEVISKINRHYHSNITLGNPELGRCRLTVTFNNEELDMILVLIEETLQLDIVKENDKIILKGEGCD